MIHGNLYNCKGKNYPKTATVVIFTSIPKFVLPFFAGTGDFC